MKKVLWVLFVVLLSVILVFCFIHCNIKDKTTDIQGDEVVFSEPKDLIMVEIDTLGEGLPSTKEQGDLPVMLKVISGDDLLYVHGKIGVQGSSTAKWPKKNWKLKFYSDSKRTETLQLKIGDSIASDHWIAKAEWIDPTMLRNGLSYRMWESMVKSRETSPQYEVDNALLQDDNNGQIIKTGAQGFPKSYPINIKVNGMHYGIHMLLLGHDPKNFNIDYNNPNHLYMEFDARYGYTLTKTWEKFSAEGIGEWISGYHPKEKDFSEEQKSAISTLGNIINGTQDNFEKNFNKYFDKTNMIDMLLFIELIYDWDAVAQDIEMVTYDLKKWYMLPWDKDTTFGIFWDGTGLIKDSETSLVINYEIEDPTQKPWYKTYHAFTQDVEARYADLRNSDIFSVNNLNKLANTITDKIPEQMWVDEKVRWESEGRPSTEDLSRSQIVSWFIKRLEMLDKHFNYIN